MVWHLGRVVPDYHFLYITQGEGEFESKATGLIRIKTGDLVILHPQMWHRYRPVVEVGWHEYWLEFDGQHARALMNRKEFSPQRPVLHLGDSQSFLQVFLRVFAVLRKEPPDCDLILGSLAIEAIAEALSALKGKCRNNRNAVEVIREAKQRLAEQPTGLERMDQFAARLHLSYSSFRRLFKSQTGSSPGHFALELRLRRASELLATTEIPMGRIAEALGFHSIYYFSRAFKKQTGQTPSSFRKVAHLGQSN